LREAELRNRVRSRCSGEQYDSDLGLYHLRARYYNPYTGRFMSRDPLAGVLTDSRTLHKYLYANGDPTNEIDPTGRGMYEVGFRLARIYLQVKKLWACGVAIYGLYKLIDSALDNALNQPGHTYVSQWAVLLAVATTVKTCAQDYVMSLIKSYF
jgi:RHS repeat-associated protein